MRSNSASSAAVDGVAAAFTSGLGPFGQGEGAIAGHGARHGGGQQFGQPAPDCGQVVIHGAHPLLPTIHHAAPLDTTVTKSP